MKRLLVLEDGTVFEGEAFGADLYVTGELVFTTAMTGYQELITDQAFSGQILSFTFPVIGATGIDYAHLFSSSRSASSGDAEQLAAADDLG